MKYTILKFLALPKGKVWILSKQKRISDFVLAIIVFPFAFLITIATILGHVLTKEKIVIFKQERIGKNGRIFNLYKFRISYADSSETQDPSQIKYTRFGKLMSVLGSDETPQLLYNVWIGNMTIIGPRPLVPGDFFIMQKVLTQKEYNQWYYAYILCRPAWMGAFSQRSRLYKSQSLEYLRARHKWDCWYLKNASLSVDIKIFFRSLAMWCTDPKDLLKATMACFKKRT